MPGTEIKCLQFDDFASIKTDTLVKYESVSLEHGDILVSAQRGLDTFLSKSAMNVSPMLLP